MKIRRVLIENVRSFLSPQEFKIEGDIAIIIGPNGGGKTNLLDTISIALRLFLLKSWVPRHNPTTDWNDRYDWIANDAITASLLEKHSSGLNKSQRIEIDIEITSQDIENIKKAKEEASILVEKAKGKYTSIPIEVASNWDISDLHVGNVYTYKIIDNNLSETDINAAKVFREYLNIYEVDSRIRSELEVKALSTPMISLPVNRSMGGLQVSIALADFNEFDHKRQVDAASSRSAGSIMYLGIGRLARYYRQLLEEDSGEAKKKFYSSNQLTSFSSILKSLGYEWEMVCINIERNQYDIRLKKQGSSFLVGFASSGEKELLIYLFAIYALNIKDALILVDEPELHLHPRWQKTLLELFEKLTIETGNQFIMATHSPVFVSPSSIQYVSRVFSEHQESKIIRLTESNLPQAKHLLNIVNSQNNERLFFADRVVLVEGVSDRIYFEAIFRSLQIGKDAGIIYEIIDVGGKGMFKPYEKLLGACKIPYSIIADLDYINQVGTEEVKSLLVINEKNIKEKVLEDNTSVDGASLVALLDSAIKSNNVGDLTKLWTYIKSRHTVLKSELEESEQANLDNFIKGNYKQGLFILSRGALEAYLPEGYKSKDMEKLIELVSNENFIQLLPNIPFEEINKIVQEIQSNIEAK